MKRHFFLAPLVLLASFTLHARETITLAVANSTCDAVKKAGDAYKKNNDVDITYICKSSGLLAKGVKGGAISADIYISANQSWMDFMVEGGVVEPQQVTSPWGNTLVVAARKDSPLELNQWEELASDKVKKILIGDPGTAPFGRYAKESLETTHLWDRVKDKIETKKNISLLAESLAEENPGTVGILFYSNIGDELMELYSIDPEWHEAIRYYMAPVKRPAPSAHSDQLIRYLRGEQGQAIFREAHFFIVVDN